MELLLAVVVLGAIVAGGVAWHERFGDPVTSPWQGLAEACGLAEIQPVTRVSHAIRGRLETLEVQFGSYVRNKTQASTVLTVNGLPQLLAVKREGLGTRIGKALGMDDFEIGDDSFDRTLHVQGDEALLCALLDVDTRRRLVDAFSGGLGPEGSRDDFALQLSHGELKASFLDDYRRGPLPQLETVRALLELARRLQRPSDLTARLVQGAERDPVPGVRRRILRTLDRTAHELPATRKAMVRAAREDPDGAVRLMAALWMGETGAPTLEALAIDGTVEDAVSARAIEELGEHLPLDRARRALEESTAAGRGLTIAAVAVVLGRGGESEVAPLAAALERAQGPVAAVLARALGRTGSERAEGPLLAALARESEEVQAAAAAALGQVGTAASVLPLRELAQGTRGPAFEPALGALALIRKRLEGADPGRLSLAGADDGGLALADDVRGQVALPDPEDPA